MFDAALRKKLIRSNSLEEVEKLLSEHPDLDAKRVYQEIEKHRPGSSEKLDLSELEAVSGGADRNWAKDGCAATCEENNWCWSNDKCQIWDVTYEDFFICYLDGHEHVCNVFENRCTRCGHVRLSVFGCYQVLKF